MVGSSLRNSIHRRNHKERGQLVERSKRGLLEKHKDYVQRAKDYNSKRDRIKRLKEKAALKNKDEFYFGMVNSRTDKGVHIQSRGNAALPVELVKVLKTQDANYVRTQRAVGQNKIQRLKAQLASIADLLPGTSSSTASTTTAGAAGLGSDSEDDESMEDAELNEAEQATLRAVGLLEAEKKSKAKGKARAQPRKIIFKETKEEIRNYSPSAPFASSYSSSSASSPRQPPVASTSTAPDLGWIEVTPKADIKKAKREAKKAALSSSVTSAEQASLDAEARKLAAKKHRLLLLRTLQSHLTRDSALSAVEKEMALQRALMGKGAKKRISKGGKEVAQIGDDEGDDEEDDERGGKKGEWKGRTFKWKAERRK